MHDFGKRTWQLALSYLMIIMTLSLMFSAILYGVMSAQLDRPLPPGQQNEADVSSHIRDRIAERDRQARGSMILSLIVLNAVMLLGGAWFSYFLALRTLQPIREAMEAQSQFVSDASHELRTPLTALLTTNEVALRKKKLSEEKAREVLQKNIVEVDKLRHLTETLLTLSQVEQRTVTREPVPLDELVHESIESLEDAARAKSITIENKTKPETVLADALALTQVIKILIDNAIKYSPDNTTVRLTTTQVNNLVTLHIIDHGIGIAPEDQEHIFDRFYRADAARTRTDSSGHGLGLAIARSLALEQQHELTFVTTVGSGTEFMITMPRAATAQT